MAVEKKQNGDAGLGCGVLIALVAFSVLGLLFFHIWSPDVFTSLLVSGAVVVCVVSVCATYFGITRMQLADAARTRLLEENRQSEVRMQELEMKRLELQLEMARLQAPSPQK